MAPDLTLYRADGACSLVPHILLKELNITFTSVRMTLGPSGLEPVDGSVSHSDYLKLNPSGLVPTLKIARNEHGHETITELPAILTYIASLAPERQLFGRLDLEKAKVYQWLCWLSGTMHGVGYGAIWRPERFLDDGATRAAIVEQGRKKVGECYERIEASLQAQGKQWMVGDEMTIVDLNLYLFWRWAQREAFDMSGYPDYARLCARVERIDSMRAALEEEGLSLQVPGVGH